MQPIVYEYTCYTDGASRHNPGKAGAGIFIHNNYTHAEYRYSVYLGDKVTNNVAEYNAFILCLKYLSRYKAQSVEIFVDSELLAKQINGEYTVRNIELKSLHTKAISILKTFRSYRVVHVRREKNKIADALANKAIDEHNV